MTALQPPRAVVVVPCFDEERRLDRDEFLRLARGRTGVHVLFVDDGSRDGTRAMLQDLCAQEPARLSLLALDGNHGKGEAVRAGLREALGSGARLVGYADADLSTPVDELLRMIEAIASAPVNALLGSRVRLLGYEIDRHAWRHYVGRVFATFASLALDLPVYDTQCGAKLFAPTPALAASLERPFASRWIFDVELLSRLIAPPDGTPALRREEIHEFPLRVWRDVAGSKLGAGAMLKAGLQIVALFVRSRWSARRASARRAASGLPGRLSP